MNYWFFTYKLYDEISSRVRISKNSRVTYTYDEKNELRHNNLFLKCIFSCLEYINTK